MTDATFDADVPQVFDVLGDQRTDAIEQAAMALRAGGLVALPTDTRYGLAADAFNQEGTEYLRSVRRQPRSAPLPVLVRSPKQLIGLTPTVPKVAERLMAAFWPGPLTMVIPAEPSLRWDLGDAEGTVAVRMPLDDVTLEVIRSVGPLAVTGAHRVGEEPQAEVAQIVDVFGDEIAVYLDAGMRDTPGGSTIVDLTRTQPHLLRDGLLPADIVLAVARGELDPLMASDAVDRGATSLDDVAPPPDQVEDVDRRHG